MIYLKQYRARAHPDPSGRQYPDTRLNSELIGIYLQGLSDAGIESVKLCAPLPAGGPARLQL